MYGLGAFVVFSDYERQIFSFELQKSEAQHLKLNDVPTSRVKARVVRNCRRWTLYDAI